MTRDQVLCAAREAFSERGYEGTTLAAIAARLDVSPAALLRHAPSKEALFALAMSEPEREPLPTDFLSEAPADDPVRALKRLARQFVPFIERKMGENIARFLRARSEEEARTIRLPFDPRKKTSPPVRALRAVESYLRRARAAGTVTVRNPRAAALAFLGTMQSYVFLHRILGIEPPIPLERYLDTVLEIWRHGALRRPRGNR